MVGKVRCTRPLHDGKAYSRVKRVYGGFHVEDDNGLGSTVQPLIKSRAEQSTQ